MGASHNGTRVSTSSKPSGTTGLAADRCGKDQGWVLWWYHRSESEHQLRSINSKIKHVMNSGEEKRLNYSRDQLIGTQVVYAVWLLTSTWGPSVQSTPSAGRIRACTDCNTELQESLLSFIRAVCLQHLPPKQSSLTLKVFRNSQSSKIYMDACRSTHASIYVYITCFIYKSRFCIGTGWTDVKARPHKTCSNRKEWVWQESN